jgi:hypothetical protein
MTIQTPLAPALWTTERKMRFLAKELAVDIVEPEKICEQMEISVDEWDQYHPAPDVPHHAAGGEGALELLA